MSEIRTGDEVTGSPGSRGERSNLSATPACPRRNAAGEERPGRGGGGITKIVDIGFNLVYIVIFWFPYCYIE